MSCHWQKLGVDYPEGYSRVTTVCVIWKWIHEIKEKKNLFHNNKINIFSLGQKGGGLNFMFKGILIVQLSL